MACDCMRPHMKPNMKRNTDRFGIMVTDACAKTLRLVFGVVLGWFVGGGVGSSVAAEPVYIGFDRPYSGTAHSTVLAIELGTQLAISEINGSGGVLNGRPLVLMTTDNRDVPAKAEDNFRAFANQDDLVAVYGSKTSSQTTPYWSLSNELGLVWVNVWGSAEPLAASPAEYPFVYHLSLRDKWAIPAMMRHAKATYGAQRLCSVLPKTPWGRHAEGGLAHHAKSFDQALVHVGWYGGKETEYSLLINRCVAEGAQAVILIADEQSGAAWIKAMAAQPVEQRLPTVAHWGLSGGAIDEVPRSDLNALAVDIIQSFTFIRNERPVAEALGRTLLDDQRFTTLGSISSPAALAQAYDATHLLALAIDKAGSTERDQIRRAMQTIEVYDGAIRTYERPFSDSNHDALTAQQVLFVKLQPDGALYPIETHAKEAMREEIVR